MIFLDEDFFFLGALLLLDLATLFFYLKDGSFCASASMMAPPDANIESSFSSSLLIPEYAIISESSRSSF